MKILTLKALEILNQACAVNLNHVEEAQKEGFYNYYMHKDIEWLIENRKKIIDDFIKYDEQGCFEFERNCFKKGEYQDYRDIFTTDHESLLLIVEDELKRAGAI